MDGEDCYIKSDKCINGIITNGRKRYIDLMFSSSDNTFVEWIELIEETLQKNIEKSSGLNELSIDDIEKLMHLSI